MPELAFLRHGPRADHSHANEEPLHSPYKVYDPSVTTATSELVAGVAAEISRLASFPDNQKKNIYVHFSPYLRCCETADLLATQLSRQLEAAHPGLPLKLQLLGDFALSEWIHDKMRNKPPFFDSNEAYQMYTPNIQTMANKKLVSNFRPTTKLGPWNEPDLSYKAFQERCKEYFEKLLATYDRPASDNDLIIVVSHGYVVSNMLSHFISQPIFEEIPELGVNFVRKIDGVWSLVHDCLNILVRNPDIDPTLNLDSDIVYYKTNFVKRTDADDQRSFPAMGFGGLKGPENLNPRPSFRLESKSENNALAPANRNPLCPSAKDWNPNSSAKYKMQSEFRLKVMNDEAFKKAFDLSKHPRQPISPEVSPNSEPSRINSAVDLSKLASNEEIYHPLKLRYSSASDIPVQHLNSKVNSHVSLSHLQRMASSNSSGDNMKGMQLSYFSGSFSGGSASPADQPSDVESSPNMNEVISRLARVRSLQKRRPQNTTPKFGIISEQDTPSLEDADKRFSLQFAQAVSQQPQPERPPLLSKESTPISTFNTRPRRSSSVKFIPSVLTYNNGRSDKKKEKQATLFNLNSPSESSDDSSDEQDDGKYVWFGQNVKHN